MKKTIICILLCITTLFSMSACKKEPMVEEEQKVEEEKRADLTFSRESFPRLDGSTSMVPLGQGIASVLLGETREAASDLISFNKTTQSFSNLMYGECDLVIAAEPKASVFEEMENEGFEYEIETIAKEALVFVVNASNPVDSLTTKQLQDIYSGKITNWKDVGGNDAPIAAFQRNASAGSQVMMDKLVMGDIEMMSPPVDLVEESMGGLIEGVKSYDNSANAIGYTVYYYADDMAMADGLKIISVDDVMANPESIRQENYPFINGYYCCIPKTSPKDSMARLLYDWLVSSRGQELLSTEGYVSVYKSGEAPTKGDNIIIDDSKYVPYGAPQKKYTRRTDEPVTELVASDDYGMLLPYCGSVAYTDYFSEGGMYYGFCNTKGELITDAVYLHINSRSFEDASLSPIWTLSKADENSEYSSVKFAGLEGDFVSEKAYNYITTNGNKIFATIYDGEKTFCDIYDHKGNLLISDAGVDYDNRHFVLESAIDGGYIGHAEYEEGLGEEYVVFDEQLQPILGPYQNIIKTIDNKLIVTEYDDIEKVTDISGVIYQYHNFSKFNFIRELTDELFQADGIDGVKYVLSLDGRVIASGADYYQSIYHASLVRDGFYSCTKKGYNEELMVYTNSGDLVFKGVFPLESDDDVYIDYAGIDELFFYCNYNESIESIFCNTKTQEVKKFPDLNTISSGDIFGKYIWLYGYTESGEYVNKLYDRNLELVKTAYDFTTLYDELTSTMYACEGNIYGFSGTSAIYKDSLDEAILSLNGNISVWNNYFITTSEFACSCYDLDGNLIFCYPFYGSSSGD